MGMAQAVSALAVSALTVSALAVSAVGLTATAAVSAPAPGRMPQQPLAVATDGPDQQDQQDQQDNQQDNNQPPATEFTNQPEPTGDTQPSYSANPSYSYPSYTPSYSYTPTPSGSSSGSPGPTPRPGGGGGGGGGTGCGGANSPPVTVQMGTAGGNEALVDQSGCALYIFTKDTPDTSACDAQCESTWPPLAAPAKAGSGVQQANLGTFARAGGKQQATFFGKQLYRYSGDNQPGDANGQGKDQSWYLVDKNGNPITD
jgi:predicted lipoprotein with Yx(FWY)xxD motif